MRHAFLIMAHNKWDILVRLIKKLDHKDNAIYLHIDLKSELSEEDKEAIQSACRESQIIFVERTSVVWGGYSQINCELRMMEEASRSGYDYYHMMSGIDFPIKSMQYIHDYFANGKKYEYIHFADESSVQDLENRYEQYHFLQEYVGRKDTGILKFIEKISLYIQRKLFKITRTDKYSDLVFKVGSNWCSLTDECVKYLLSKKKDIKKIFNYSLCCDELFVQTMIFNSYLKERICFHNLRSIDWQRGNPYTYVENDYDELVKSDNLFCRKVDNSITGANELINKLELL